MNKGSFFNKIKDVARNAIKTPEGRGDYDEDDDDRDFFSLGDDDSYDKYYDEPEKPKFTNWQQKQPETPAYTPAENKFQDYKEPLKPAGNLFQMKQQTEAAPRKFKFALVKIDKIESSVAAADFMLSGNTVALLDLHDIPENAARRVIDFLDGVRYTCNARIELIADRTYVIVPETVELSGDFLSQVDTNGFRF